MCMEIWAQRTGFELHGLYVNFIHWEGENEMTGSVVYDFVILDYLIPEVVVEINPKLY